MLLHSVKVGNNICISEVLRA